MSLRIVLIALCLGAIAASARGKDDAIPTAAPEDVGMSTAALAKIDQAMQARVDADELVGGSVLVSRHGKAVYYHQFGLMDAEAKKPFGPDTIVRIYSMSKAVTSVAAMMLCDEGKLALDDPVEKYLPELAHRTVYDPAGNRPAKTTMTIRDLLRHTSGLIYGNAGGTEIEKQYAKADNPEEEHDLKEFITRIAPLPVIFDPGTDWRYGTSTDVLGAVVERASGEPLDEFFRERICKPLGMVDTAFEVPADKLDRFAACYEWKDGQRTVQDAPITSRYAKKVTLFSGGGGLVSTATDYWRLMMMLADGGEFQGVRLLKPETVEAMTHNQLNDTTGWIDDKPGHGFGLGFKVIVEPIPDADRRMLGEYSWGGMASTHYWTNPREELSVVTMEQKLPYSTTTEDVVKPLVYDAIVDPHTP